MGGWAGGRVGTVNSGWVVRWVGGWVSEWVLVHAGGWPYIVRCVTVFFTIIPADAL